MKGERAPSSQEALNTGETCDVHVPLRSSSPSRDIPKRENFLRSQLAPFYSGYEYAVLFPSGTDTLLCVWKVFWFLEVFDLFDLLTILGGYFYPCICELYSLKQII